MRMMQMVCKWMRFDVFVSQLEYGLGGVRCGVSGGVYPGVCEWKYWSVRWWNEDGAVKQD